MQLYIQGDVAFLLTDRNPEYLNGVGIKTVVKGVTGNNHDAVNGKFYQGVGNSRYSIGFLNADKNCKIVHPEHPALKLPKGVYEVRRQRELWNGKEHVVVD